MTGRKPDTDPAWNDPDDAPELTDETLDIAEFAVGGKVVRPARGVLGPDGVIWHSSSLKIRKRPGQGTT
jgi:hypothetical protein